MKILTTLIDIAMALTHLLEAEGRILKRAVVNAGWALAFIGVASLLVATAAGFFLAGIYQYLIAQMSPVAASLVVSLIALLLALVFVIVAKWRIADPK